MRKLKRNLALVLALVLAFALAIPAAASAPKPVGTDSKDYYSDYDAAVQFINDTYGSVAGQMITGLNAIADLGIVHGSEDGTQLNLNANLGLTRLEYVALLYRLIYPDTDIDKTIYGINNSVFEDIDDDNWGKAYANWAYLNGVSTGISASPLKFGPKNPMNYYDAMLMILSLLGVDKELEQGITEKNPTPPANNIRFMITLQIAEKAPFELVRNITIQNPMEINRAEAFNLMYYALYAKYVTYNNPVKGDFKVGDSVMKKNHSVEELKGFISATNYATLEGGATSDGAVAILKTDAGEYKIDANIAERMGLKLEGFDNISNLGDSYTVLAKIGDKNFITNFLSSAKTSGMKEFTGYVGSGSDNLKNATGNSKINADGEYKVYLDFGTATTSSISGVEGKYTNENSEEKVALANDWGKYTKIIWNSDNKVVRVIKSKSFCYQRIEKIVDGKYTIKDGSEKKLAASDILGWNADIEVNWTPVVAMSLGAKHSYVFYPETVAGTANRLSSDMETLTVNGTGYRTMKGTYMAASTGMDTKVFRNTSDWDNPGETIHKGAMAAILGTATDFYTCDIMGQKYVFGFKVSAPVTDGDLPSSYAVVLASSFTAYKPGISGISNETPASAIVVLQTEAGTATYNLVSVFKNNTTAGKAPKANEVKISDGATFSGTSSNLYYQGSSAAYNSAGAATINGLPFAYSVDAANGTVVLYEIPTLSVATATSVLASSPLSGSKFNIGDANVDKTIDSRTSLFVATKANNSAFAAFKGSDIKNVGNDAAESFKIYYANTAMNGEFSATGSYSRLVVMQRAGGSDDTKIFVAGGYKGFFTLGKFTYIAGGKAEQKVLNSDGTEETIIIADTSKLSATNEAGYFVQYALNNAGEAIDYTKFTQFNAATATATSITNLKMSDVAGAMENNSWSKANVSYLGTQGISAGGEFFFASNPDIYLIGKKNDTGKKINTSDFAGLNKDKTYFYVHLNTNGEIDKVYAVEHD